MVLSLGKKFPYYAHASFWELYYVLSGIGKIRTDTGVSDIGVGDSIMCPSGEAHQIINDSDKMWFMGLVLESESGLTFVWNGFPADYWDGEE